MQHFLCKAANGAYWTVEHKQQVAVTVDAAKQLLKTKYMQMDAHIQPCTLALTTSGQFRRLFELTWVQFLVFVSTG